MMMQVHKTGTEVKMSYSWIQGLVSPSPEVRHDGGAFRALAQGQYFGCNLERWHQVEGGVGESALAWMEGCSVFKPQNEGDNLAKIQAVVGSNVEPWHNDGDADDHWRKGC